MDAVKSMSVMLIKQKKKKEIEEEEETAPRSRIRPFDKQVPARATRGMDLRVLNLISACFFTRMHQSSLISP
jgi:hypothetical protein